MEEYIEKIKLLLMEYTPSILTAFAILIIGLFVISLLVKTARKIMLKRSVDVTLQNFLGNLLGWILKIVLFITVIAKLGIATTSFVAILGAAGLAVGLALQGSLANFAGGFNNDI
jgi:small conductance mechanosensitive channel